MTPGVSRFRISPPQRSDHKYISAGRVGRVGRGRRVGGGGSEGWVIPYIRPHHTLPHLDPPYPPIGVRGLGDSPGVAQGIFEVKSFKKIFCSLAVKVVI